MTRQRPTDREMTYVRAAWLAAVALILLALLPPAPWARASLVGDLSGVVTAAGEPLPDARVTVTPVSETGARSGAGTVLLTDASGRYHLPDLYHRRVKVGVSAPVFGRFVDTYWPGAYSFQQAQMVEVSSWPVRADIDLAAAGSLSGRVVDAQTGRPIAGAAVRAYLAAAPAAGSVGAGRPSDRSGNFTVAALPPGTLRLRMQLPVDSDYLVVPVTVRPAGDIRIRARRDTTGVELRLQRGAQIRGTVRDDLGRPVPGATIKVIGCAFACPLLATSDESGGYHIRGVRPGRRLGVVAWRGEDLLKQWYPGRDSPAAANDIDLRAGQVLDSVDFELTRAAFLTVEVRDAGGNAPVTAIVLLRTHTDQRTQYFPGHLVRWSDQRPHPGGHFQVPFGPLPPGSFELRVSPGAANPGYFPDQWLASYGVASDGTIQLDPGEQARAVVGLVPTAASATARTPFGADCAPLGDWPGLQRGFLTLTG